MKIVIGITSNPEEIGHFIDLYHGRRDSLTEVGPFLSCEEALTWKDSLKSRIGNIEEISLILQKYAEPLYYGFTFERACCEAHLPFLTRFHHVNRKCRKIPHIFGW